MDWIKPNCVFVEVTFTRNTASGPKSYTSYMPRHPSDFSQEELKARKSIFSKEYMESIGQGHLYIDPSPSQNVTNNNGESSLVNLPLRPEDELNPPDRKGKQPESRQQLAGASEDWITGHATGKQPELDNEFRNIPSITAEGVNLATQFRDAPGPVISSAPPTHAAFTHPFPSYEQMGRVSAHRPASNTGSSIHRAIPVQQGEMGLGMINRRPHGYHAPSNIHERVFRPTWAANPGGQVYPVGPSNALVQPCDMTPVPAHVLADPSERVKKGFSSKYKGNIYLDENMSANIPADQNCALFIIGLPPLVTHHQILSAIRGIGRVYQCYVNPPEPEKGNLAAACKLIFFDRASAARFYDRYHVVGFRVCHDPQYEGRVVWNRIQTGAQEHSAGKSRVLWITGPPHIVNGPNLTRYFSARIKYDVDEVIHHGGNLESAVVEYRFGSYRCQAQMAKMAMNTELTRFGVRVWFGDDPCGMMEMGDMSTAYQQGGNVHQHAQSLPQQGFYLPAA
jgi:hypothetical protein